MSQREAYQAGVPCWVETLQADPESVAGWYAEMFGWDTEDRMPADSPHRYVVCTLRGRDVAAAGSRPSEDVPPDWNTYVWVDSVDDIAAKAVAAGGSVVREPFETYDGGRTAALADPAGAVIGAWQPGASPGAQLTNEPGAWAMSILHTRDVEGAEAFYGALFGWRTEAVVADPRGAALSVSQLIAGP